MNLSDVTIIIPALNERESLPHVLDDLPPVGEVIVVNNGSTDGTENVARSMGATVVDEPKRGYGSACLAGLATVARRAEASPPCVIGFLDADYSDHPELLPQLVEPILADECDFVLGSRLMGQREPGAMPLQSVLGNRFACALMRMFFAAKYTDLGPFRAMRYASLLTLEMVDTNYGWTIEMQIKAHRAGLRYREVPVPYRRRIGQSKISGTLSGTVKAGTKILLSIAKYGLGTAKPGA